MKIFGYEIKKAPVTTVQNALVNETATKTQQIIQSIPYQQTYSRIHQDIRTWRQALIMAENIHYPNRTELIRNYKDIYLDNHLSALVHRRKSAILSCKFEVITKAGKVDEKLTKLIQKKWFYDFCDLALDSIFWGHSLIQFGDIVDSEFAEIELVPRYYTKPEFGIVVQQPSDITGKSWNEAPYKRWTIAVGGKRELGLFSKCSPVVLWKKAAIEAWSEYIQVIGVPVRTIQTDIRDTESRENAVNMLNNMGMAAYGVLDLKDIFNVHQAEGGAAADLFDKLIDRCNTELSKLVLGSTGVMDEKSYVGSARIHQKGLDKINEQDKIFLENIFKHQLIPLLNMHGLGFEGRIIQISVDEELDLATKFSIDGKLLDYYKIPVEYIQRTYGTPVTEKAEQPGEASAPNQPEEDISNKLDKLYGIN